MAGLLFGCDSGTSPSPPRMSSGPIVRASKTDPSQNCLLQLRDGTSLALFRSKTPDGSPDDLTLTIRHQIDLQHTGESLDSEQQPLRSLSYSVANEGVGPPKWLVFEKPHENGELSFYRFYYRAVINSRVLSVPVNFKVKTEKGSYELKGPLLSEFADAPENYWRLPAL